MDHNKSRGLILAGTMLITNCINSEENIGESKKDQGNAFSARTALSVGLVDVPLTNIYRYNTGGLDHYNNTTNVNITGYSKEGCFWRVLKTTMPGVTQSNKPLWELWGVNAGVGDHMTSSVSTTEGGYGSATQLGAVFGTQDLELALFPMDRYIRTWNDAGGFHMDHMLLGYNETPPTGFTRDGNLGYGWPSYGGRGTLNVVSKNGIDIGTSIGWGGSIVSLKRNGLELICEGDDGSGTNNGSGRLMQSSVFYSASDNPTEAGDNFGNGSPVINYLPNSGGAGTGTLWTRTIGLNFAGPSVTATSPQLTGTEFEKNVAIVDANRIDHQIKIRIAKDVPYLNGYPVLEGLTAHLVDDIFTEVRMYRFNASTNNYVQITGSPWSANVNDADFISPTIPSNTSVFIVAYNPTNNFGFAIFPLNIAPYNVGDGTGTRFSFFRYLCATTGNNSLSAATLKIGTAESGFTTHGRAAKSGVLKNDVITLNHSVLIGTLGQILSKATTLKSRVTFNKW